MREEFGDIWEMGQRPNSVVCITTNGYVNARGECVMGRGVALQAKKRYPGLAKLVGQAIRDRGNHVRRFNLTVDGPTDTYIVVFPTKHVWFRPSDLELIRQSAEDLKVMANEKFVATFYLPRPGCQNGGLRWENVKPVLESVGLPDNVVVVTDDPKQWYDEYTNRLTEGVLELANEMEESNAVTD